MPEFTCKDGCYFVSYITGPAHVLLGIRFTRQPGVPRLVKMQPRGSCRHGALEETRIVEAVQEVLAAHRAEGAGVFAQEIVYVEDDSPRYDLYRLAAHRLTERYVGGEDFQSGETAGTP